MYQIDPEAFRARKEIIGRLATEYGAQSYGKERIAAIMRRFGQLSLSDLNTLIERCFETERIAPMAKDLDRIWETIRAERYARSKETFKSNIPPDPVMGDAASEKVKHLRDIITGASKKMPLDDGDNTA